MTTLLPKDADNNIIPALRLRDDAAHTVAVTTTAARNATAFDVETKVISIFATVPVYLRFGDDSVAATASDHYFPANIYYDVAIAGGGAHNTHLSALRAEEDGFVYISEKE